MNPKFGDPFENQIANPFQRSAEMIFGESWRVLLEENTKFMNQQMSDSMKAFEQIAASRTPPELFTAHQNWFEESARAYGEHWQKCAQLIRDAIEESANDVETKAKAADKTETYARGLQRTARDAFGR